MLKKMTEGKINEGSDDEMVIFGFCRSYFKTFLTFFGVILSCGLLLIFLSWRRSYKMLFTHSRCALEDAKKVLLIDSYQQEYVETVMHTITSSNYLKEYVYFYNKKVKYLWISEENKFSKIEGLQITSCAHFHAMSKGLDTTEAVCRLQFYGENSIFVKVQPVCKLILQEVQSPFYIYQMFIVAVWLIQLYYQFAICIVLLSIISVTVTVWETRQQSKALRDAVKSKSMVAVLRDGKEIQKSSEELVPGDVIILPEVQFTMICDAVLLNGSCVVNESMLTGESTPITKVSIANDAAQKYSNNFHKKSTVFCGTQILHTRRNEDGLVRAVVHRTGFNTSKGELVRAILFPKPVNFKLYSDLLKCMIMFFFIGAVPIIYSTIIWIQLQAHVKDVIIIVADVVTFLVPPVLPAVLTSINAHAQKRLKKKGIFCLNSRYINCCGMLDVVCFDKTGTLTSGSLDFSGAVLVENSKFQPAVKNLVHLHKGPFLTAMLACHSLTKVNGKILGDMMDLKIFEETNWDLDEPTKRDQVPFENLPQRIVFPKASTFCEQRIFTLAIVRQFPFESLLRRMCVVTKTEGNNYFEVYLKGAPEIVASFCLPNSIPDDFKQVLELYTRQGFRVIAVGSKILPPSITWNDVLLMKRDDLERNLNFDGLVVLQNCLKSETVPSIKILKEAEIRAVMVTGDNLLTAITVARDCGMIKEYDSVVSVEAEINQTPYDGQLQRLQINYCYAKLPGYSEKLNITHNGIVDEMCFSTIFDGQYHIAIDGKSFNLIRLHDTQLLMKIVHRGTIFARMLPEHKLFLIEALQGLGHYVGMCGDGANDCGALKIANAGVSLSVAEASVASPFTATQENIECIPIVIREGRATLVAIFGAFKYMVCYCFVLLSAVLIMFWDGQKPSDGGYVIIDIVLNLLPPILFGSTAAYEKLVKRRPMRSIFSFLPLFSMMSFLLLQIAVYIFAYVYCSSQTWYEPFIYDRSKTHTPAKSYMGTTVLSINMMSYVIASVIFSPGPPYRKNILSNKLYTSVVTVEFLLVSLLIVYPPDWIAWYINFKRAPFIEYHLMMYMISLANFAISYIWEVFIIQGYFYHYILPIMRRKRGPLHKYEKIEQDLVSKNNWPPLVGMLKGQQLNDDIDTNNMKLSSITRRDHWARRSSELRRSLLVSLKLSKSSERKDSRVNSMTFFTFRDGMHKTEEITSKETINQSYV